MRLEAGVKIRLINDREGTFVVGVGTNARSITVVEVYGQMAPVPWACCEMDNVDTMMINLANVESVILLDDGGVV